MSRGNAVNADTQLVQVFAQAVSPVAHSQTSFFYWVILGLIGSAGLTAFNRGDRTFAPLLAVGALIFMVLAFLSLRSTPNPPGWAYLDAGIGFAIFFLAPILWAKLLPPPRQNGGEPDNDPLPKKSQD
jgi:hypothetical protein